VFDYRSYLLRNNLWQEPGSITLEILRDRRRFGGYEFWINGRSGEMASFVAIPVRGGRCFPQFPRIDLATLPPTGKGGSRRRPGLTLLLLAFIIWLVYWFG
jgi:hypothetical protein